MGEASCPKATIVVPVYNSARSIQRCLDSLLAQSERSIQVVCVNDGSTDDSLNALRQIAQADERVLEVLEDWAAYGLLDLCPGELITWFLDLIVFDLARLDSDDFHRVAARVNMDLTTFLGTEWADMPAKGAVRRVAHKLVAATSGVSMADATLFYLSTRGLKACLERFL